MRTVGSILSVLVAGFLSANPPKPAPAPQPQPPMATEVVTVPAPPVVGGDEPVPNKSLENAAKAAVKNPPASGAVKLAPAPAAKPVRKYPPWVRVIRYDPSTREAVREASADAPVRATPDAKATAKATVKNGPAKAEPVNRKANPKSKAVKAKGLVGFKEDDLHMLMETLGWIRTSPNRRVRLDRAPQQDTMAQDRFKREAGKVTKALRNVGVKAASISGSDFPPNAEIHNVSYSLSNGIRLTLATLPAAPAPKK